MRESHHDRGKPPSWKVILGRIEMRAAGDASPSCCSPLVLVHHLQTARWDESESEFSDLVLSSPSSASASLLPTTTTGLTLYTYQYLYTACSAWLRLLYRLVPGYHWPPLYVPVVCALHERLVRARPARWHGWKLNFSLGQNFFKIPYHINKSLDACI
jgi:hypothetical protein